MADNKSQPQSKRKLLSSTQLTRKNKIILSVVVGVIAFAVLFLGLYISDPNKGGESALDKAKRESGYTETDFTVNPGDTVGSETAWLEQSESEIESNKTGVQSLETQIADLQAQVADIKEFSNIPDKGSAERVGRIPVPTSSVSNVPPQPQFTPPPPQPPQPQFTPPPQNQQALLPPPPSASGQGESLNNNSQQATTPQRKISHINVSGGSKQGSNSTSSNNNNDDEKQSGSNRLENKNVSSYVPSGAFAKSVLLSGVDAPTGGLASSNPVPVLLRIKDKGTLANYFKSDLKECTAIGAAAGDISSERVNIRLESITCVLVNGDIIEKPIKGYVSGEDGKAGFRGRLVSKQGSLIAKSAMAGIAGGLGSAVTEQYKNISTSPLGQVTSIDPDKAVQSGLSQGFGNAMEKIADFYIQRANETYPIIELASARVGDIVLTQGVDFGIDHIGKKRNK